MKHRDWLSQIILGEARAWGRLLAAADHALLLAAVILAAALAAAGILAACWMAREVRAAYRATGGWQPRLPDDRPVRR